MTDKERRDRNRELGRCVNDTKQPTHGALVAQGRCARCLAVKNRPRLKTPMSIACPECHARPCVPCRSSTGKPTRVHGARVDTAHQLTAALVAA